MAHNLQLVVKYWLSIGDQESVVKNLQSMVKVVKNWQALWKSNWLSFNNFRIGQQISEVSMGVSDSSETD